MKRLLITQYIVYSISLILGFFCIISCINQEKENNDSIFKTESRKLESPIDFNLIDCLNESNKKNIDLSSIAFLQTKDVKTLQLLLKIKRNHQKIDRELKKLTEKNLIIIPKLVYSLNINSDSLKGKNASLHLLNLLESENKNQFIIFKQIENTSQSIDFKIFAIQSKKILKSNIDSLKSL